MGATQPGGFSIHRRAGHACFRPFTKASYADMMPGVRAHELTADDYEALAEFRYQIRRFLHFSEKAARFAGLNPQQHQLLLTLKGLPKGVEPNIGEIAERLHIRHHSAVELTDRLTERQLVDKRPSPVDRRRVLLEITAQG